MSCIRARLIPDSLLSLESIDGIRLSLCEMITHFAPAIFLALVRRLAWILLRGYAWALRNSASVSRASRSSGLSASSSQASFILLFESVNGSHDIRIVYEKYQKNARKSPKIPPGNGGNFDCFRLILWYFLILYRRSPLLVESGEILFPTG